ncbi:bleomycin resistance protein [Elioraea sp.]|uniref:bleomycin resistance protein n=1 Tax=Elioraea sp. TaxID=2185103 RepID=UPI003F6F21B8
MSAPDDGGWARLVPELIVSDLDASLAFWCGTLGFGVRFTRPEHRFACLQLGTAQVMLEQLGDRSWGTGPLDRPFGRGINLQIEVDDVTLLHARLIAAGVGLYRDLAVAWYRDGEIEHGQAQLLVQDPDGYLLRFCTSLGTRPVTA